MELTADERRTLVDLLLRLPNIDTPAARRLLLVGLPSRLQDNVAYSDVPAIHIANIVDTVTGDAWAQLRDGSPALAVVVTNAGQSVEGSLLGQQLIGWLAAVQARQATAPPLPVAVAPPPPPPDPAIARPGTPAPPTAPARRVPWPIWQQLLLLLLALLVGFFLVAGPAAYFGGGIYPAMAVTALLGLGAALYGGGQIGPGAMDTRRLALAGLFALAALLYLLNAFGSSGSLLTGVQFVWGLLVVIGALVLTWGRG